MQIQDFAKEYTRKADEELLRLALVSDQLTPEAQLALSAELRDRGLESNSRRLEFQRTETERTEEQKKETGELWMFHPLGIGRNWFGKSSYGFDSTSGLEEFSTTIFVVLFWLPLVPTGTYRVQRKKQFLSSGMKVLEKLALDWNQILKVWMIAVVCLLCLIWGFRLLVAYPFRTR